MERIILRREKAITVAIYIVYSLFVLWMMTDRVFDFEVLSQPLNINYHYFLYGYMLLILSLRVVRESLIYSRITSEDTELLLRGAVWSEVLKVIVQLVCHILFWISIMNEYNRSISFIYLVALYTLPNFSSNSVYSSKDYIVHNGIKYYYEFIESCMYRGYGSVEIRIDHKKYYITWKDVNECEKMYQMIKSRLKD